MMKLVLLFLLLVTFIGVVAWVFRPGSIQHYKDMANLPLQD